MTKNLTLLFAVSIILMSGKCNKAPDSSSIETAETYEKYGGAYGSGTQKVYTITFNDKLKDTIQFDSLVLSFSDSTALLKKKSDQAWSLHKLENGKWQLIAIFTGGSLMQNDGTVKDIPFKQVSKPAEMGINEGLIYGKFKTNPVKIPILRFEQNKTIHTP